VWAQVVALGVPDELYWRSTPYEVQQLVRAIVGFRQQDAKAATLRAGLVAAAIYNVNRRKGAKVIKPQDFVREPAKPVDPNQMAEVFKAWARAHNRRAANEQERTR
jgi:hypothetical protein